MQIDWNPNELAVGMDHLEGEITQNDVISSGVPYAERNRKNTTIILHNNNAVNLTVFLSEPIDFRSQTPLSDF